MTAAPRRRARSRVAAVAAVTAATATAAATGTAFGAWTTPAGGGSGTAAAGTLGTPPTVTATAQPGRAVRVTWTAVTPAPGGYRVERRRSNGDWEAAGPGCASPGAASATCTDAAVPPGQWFYRVAARQGAWLGTPAATTAPVAVNGAPANQAGEAADDGAGRHPTPSTPTPATTPVTAPVTTPGATPAPTATAPPEPTPPPSAPPS
ncbi:hypothetical protein [Pilimelia terevasa]|uniref:hypothetical protein n=1 Tax=Pilimelia terevasa TaxID=53372 RepID=UPI0016696776|nr:hypothetical protein [Pilimelia terevasa]